MGLAWRMQVLKSHELGPDLLCATFLVKGSANIIERADLGRRELNAHEGASLTIDKTSRYVAKEKKYYLTKIY